MRVRQESQTGDYLFGQGTANFLVNSPAAVAQVLKTRLLFWADQYFADTSQGMPWETNVFGFNAAATYDQAIQQYILQTEGVSSIVSYSSVLNETTRVLVVNVVVQTAYSQSIAVSVPIPLAGV